MIILQKIKPHIKIITIFVCKNYQNNYKEYIFNVLKYL